MLGILYLLVAITGGYFLIDLFIPHVFNINKFNTLNGKPIEISKYVFIIPSSFVVGTIFLSWITYIFCYISKDTERPMFYGNLISIALCTVFSLTRFFKSKKKAKRSVKLKNTKYLEQEPKIFNLNKKTYIFEFIGISLLIIYTSVFILGSFRGIDLPQGGRGMRIGYSVYSDFGSHIDMIKSFAYGNNFPTEYPHFADGTIRYHFMFNFLVGNLEYLGLYTDLAYNIPSIMATVSFLMLLYCLSLVLFGKPIIGALTILFFEFRSSFSYIYEIFKAGSINAFFAKIRTYDSHLASTPFENWGLWSQKTFINQRHYLFIASVMIFSIIVFYPLYRKVKDSNIKELDSKPRCNFNIRFAYQNFIMWFKNSFLKKSGWIIENKYRTIFMGLIIGLSSFFNGAIVISILIIIGALAVFSRHRLEFIVVASISLSLTYLQTKFFMGSLNGGLNLKLFIGFIANDKGLNFLDINLAKDILQHYIKLLGILPLLILAAFLFLPKGVRWLMISFSMPFVFGNMFQLSPEIAINAKFVICSILLQNIFVAAILVNMFTIKLKFSLLSKIATVIIILLLTITGIFEINVLRNIDKLSVIIPYKEDRVEWIKKYSSTKDILLTHHDVTNEVLRAGRKIFVGHYYFPWSAGYDTNKREAMLKRIYGCKNKKELVRLVSENNIAWILIDDSNRYASSLNPNAGEYYFVNEDLISKTFKREYKNNQFVLYKVSK